MEENNIHANVHFVHHYNDIHIKKTIRSSKELNTDAYIEIAKSLYTWITSHTPCIYTLPHQTKTLILHSPSSTFAKSKRQHDQMAIICGHIKRLFDTCPTPPFTKIDHISLDIALHIFLINRKYRKAQHDKSKSERETPMTNKYTLLNKSCAKFLGQYDVIYIIDDVITTGSTLNQLSAVLTSNIDIAKTMVILLAFCH